MRWLLRLAARRWRPLTLVVLGAITVLSLMPMTASPDLPGSDKTHHLIAYLSLAFPVSIAQPRRWLVAVAGFLAWSGMLELVQPCVGRSGDVRDLLANGIGLCLGIGLAAVLRKYATDRVSDV